MKPYPWTELKKFGDRVRIGRAARKLSWLFLFVAFVASPFSLVAFGWALLRYFRKNDYWAKRPIILLLVGGIVTLATFRPTVWLRDWFDFLVWFGPRANTDSWQQPLWEAIGHGTGPALLLVAVSAAAWCYEYEWNARRYLRLTRPTLTMKLKKKRNVRTLQDGAQTDGFIKTGVITDDPIPWRTARYGMVVERPLDRLGHGCITGANGTGKTVAGMTVAYYTLMNGGSVSLIDCKGSMRTQAQARAIAEKAGVPFYSFDMGFGAGRSTWYDPLGWSGSPSEKASMLLGSFTFAEGGPAEYYKTQAYAWAPIQFEVMDKVGLRGGESRFDFLLDTCTPSGLRARFEHFRRSEREHDRHLHDAWSARVGEFKADDLGGLRGNLENVVNAAGPRLRPTSVGEQPISLYSLAEEQCVIYIGLSATTDDIALKTIGSLAIKDLTVMAGQRMRNLNTKLRDILVLTDEASRLDERTVVMDNLFTLAREACMWAWPITQSFATWPTSTVTEMTTNALTQIAYRLPDTTTAETMTNALGTIPTLTEMSEQRVEHQAFREENVHSEGSGRAYLQRGPHLRADRLLSVPNYHAYIWFTGTWTRATKRNWRSRRVQKEDIPSDAPLILVVPPNEILDPPPIKDDAAPAFSDLVANPQELMAWSQTNDGGHEVKDLAPLTEPQRRRVQEYRAQRGQQDAAHSNQPSPQNGTPFLADATANSGIASTAPWYQPDTPAAGEQAGTIGDAPAAENQAVSSSSGAAAGPQDSSGEVWELDTTPAPTPLPTPASQGPTRPASTSPSVADEPEWEPLDEPTPPAADTIPASMGDEADTSTNTTRDESHNTDATPNDDGVAGLSDMGTMSAPAMANGNGDGSRGDPVAETPPADSDPAVRSESGHDSHDSSKPQGHISREENAAAASRKKGTSARGGSAGGNTSRGGSGAAKKSAAGAGKSQSSASKSAAPKGAATAATKKESTTSNSKSSGGNNSSSKSKPSGSSSKTASAKQQRGASTKRNTDTTAQDEQDTTSRPKGRGADDWM